MTRDNQRRRDTVSRVIGLLLLLLMLCVFSPAFAHPFTEWLWFESLGYRQLFTTRILAALALTSIAVVVSIGFLVLNWSLLPHWIGPKSRLTSSLPFSKVMRRSGSAERQLSIPTGPLRLAFTLGAVVLGVLVGLGFRELWHPYLLAKESTPFGLTDPIFGLDVGFYVFKLPWYEALLGRAYVLVGLGLLGLLARYAIFGQLKSRWATAHLSLLGSLWLGLMGLGRLLSRYGLLKANDGIVLGAGYTDVQARMPIYTIEAFLIFLAAVVLIVNLFTRQWKLFVGIGLFWIGLSLVGPVYPAVVQQFKVEPNEFSLERPYIEHNIEFTRYAYGLDQVQEADYPAMGELTPAAIERNADVLRNVRLWDYRPLGRTYGQLQEIRLYYSFHDVDIDRYPIDGALTQVMLSARELDVDELAEQAQTWVNRHLIFTHGYGLTMNAVSQVTPEGLPELIVKDIPPITEDPSLSLSQPGIYFGERTHQYVVVNTGEDEFDYPQGDANVYTRYTGPDGVRLGSPWRRTLLATRFGSAQLLLSSALSADSRIMFHRQIRERAETIAPMLWYDDDPYPVIHDGRLVWLLDAYTWTSHFPYSELSRNETGEPLNYLRNSVKVTVDAYSGEIHFYLIDPEDPIAATYARIFPDLFTSQEAMPEALRAHWRYPETLFLYQSQLYATYHMRDPQVFYNREDLWEPPQELVETEQRVMEPYYVSLRLPDSDELEFLLIRPYVPKEKQNMVAWFFARCDGEDYGELGVFKLGKDRLIYGPLQIEGRIDQDPVISQQLSLWNQRGSHSLRGNLLVIPLEDTFLYIEPLYLEAESGQLPELRRVLVAYADRIAMAPTLDSALMQIFTTEGPPDAVPGLAPSGSLQGLAAQALEHYEAAQACLSAGDWVCYGAEQTQLELILRQMAGEE
ncbi:MAG: UPF0182 family protein [Anaerolineae bacterium]